MQDHGAEADCVENKEAAPPAEDLGGRTTGDLAWRAARGETGGAKAPAKNGGLPDGVSHVKCARACEGDGLAAHLQLCFSVGHSLFS